MISTKYGFTKCKGKRTDSSGRGGLEKAQDALQLVAHGHTEGKVIIQL